MAPAPDSRLEWTITPSIAARAARGPAIVAAACLAVWLYIPFGHEVLQRSRSGRFLTTSPGRWIYLAGVLVIVAGAVAILASGVRRQPALRLDASGLEMWTELRLRRVPWDLAYAVGPRGSHHGRDVLLVALRSGKVLRLHQDLFDQPFTEVTAQVEGWLQEHGHREVQVFHDALSA